jgi:hypothetical protein
MFSVNSGFKALPFVVVSERSPMRIVRITLILIFGVIWLLSSGADAQSAVASSSNISVDDQASDFAVLAQNGLSVPWMQLAKLSESDGVSNDWFGNSAAISGNTVVVGLAGYPARSVVYLFEKPASGWRDMTQVAELTPSDGPLLEFGISVAVDGDTVVVSGYGYHNNGLEGAVGISGNAIVAGAPYAMTGSNAQQGAAYVFDVTPECMRRPRSTLSTSVISLFHSSTRSTPWGPEETLLERTTLAIIAGVSASQTNDSADATAFISFFRRRQL